VSKRLCDCTDMPQVGPLCICSGIADAIRTLGDVRRALSDVYTPEGVRIWLNSRNRNLDARVPMHLIMAGRGDEVLEQAERLQAL
jgi:hypothetical protein